MNRKELLALARERLDDQATPPLVSDSTLTVYYNRAIDEACLRSRGILDSTSSLCQFQVNVNQRRYQLDPRIIKVGRVKVGTIFQPLEPTTIRWLDMNVQNWDTPGIRNFPQWYFCDQDRGASININLVPTPSQSDRCYMSVWRMPLDSEYLKQDGDCPPLPIFLHDGLVDWVRYQVYSNDDSELRNEDKAKLAEAEFTARFGERPSGHAVKLMAVNPPRSVRGCYF